MVTNGYKKISKLLEDGVSKESLFDELMNWLPDDMICEFADDFKRYI